MRSIACFFTPVFLTLFFSCNTARDYEYTSLSGFTQGTTYLITYENREKVNYREQIEEIFQNFNLSLSVYEPASIISRINQNDDKVLVDDYFKAVFNRAIEISELTGGAFDITVGPLINAYGFGPVDRIPESSRNIDSLLQFVGYHNVSIDDNKIIKSKPGIKLDVNGIAKGYSVDVIAHFLEKRGVINYLVEIGGEIRTKGKNPIGEYWRIGIDKPIEGNISPGENLQAIIRLNNMSLATSGNYRKYYEENGKKYAHTIDPMTGYPAQSNLLSATIIANDCMTADAFATAALVMGVDKTKALLAEHRELEAFFIFANDVGEYETWYTNGLAELMIE